MFFVLNKKQKITKKFVLYRFLSSTIAFGVLHTSLICCVLIQYFKDSGMLPWQLSIIIVSKRILRIFCDSLFGILFDRFGAKVVFLIGRLLKLLSYIILLYFTNFYGFVVAMLLDGASYSSIYGKISSYIYNNLSVRKKLKLFPQAMSLYYLCIDFSVSMMTFFAGLLLKIYGYDTLIYISIATNVFSICLLIRFVPSANQELKQFKAKTIQDIFLTLKEIIKTKPQFTYLICLYGTLSFMAWQFISISSLVLLDMKLSSVELAMCGSLLKFIMGFGALISVIIFKQGLSLKCGAKILSFSMLIGIISAIIYNPWFFYIFCALIAFIYTTIEVSIENNFEYFSDKKIRGTAISIAMTFCSFIAIISNLFIGIVAQNINYRIGLIILLALLFLLVFYLTIKISKISKII